MRRDTIRSRILHPETELSFAALRTIIAACLLAMALASAVLVWVDIVTGLLIFAITFFAIVNLYIFLENNSGRHALLVLGFIALIRIFSYALPVASIPQLIWIVLIGSPILLTIFLFRKKLGAGFMRLRLPRNRLFIELLMGLTGIPISLSAYLILKPQPVWLGLNLQSASLALIVIFFFAGFLEEFLFRALLPVNLFPILGRLTLPLVAVLYTSLFIGSMSAIYILLVLIIGLLYHYWVEKGLTIWGVAISHSIWYFGMVFLWPSIFH